MNFLNDNDETKILKYNPDYRDTILYNGTDEYIGTRRLINNRIEFKKRDDSSKNMYRLSN